LLAVAVEVVGAALVAVQIQVMEVMEELLLLLAQLQRLEELVEFDFMETLEIQRRLE
jgi:hypothetical protein